MRRKADVFLLDIWKAADYIVRRTSNMKLSGYLEDEDVRFAVERNFTIIGEAASNLRDHYPSVGAKVEALPAIVAFRNFIIHQYWSVDDESVWEIVEQDVVALRQTIAELLTAFQPIES